MLFWNLLFWIHCLQIITFWLVLWCGIISCIKSEKTKLTTGSTNLGNHSQITTTSLNWLHFFFCFDFQGLGVEPFVVSPFPWLSHFLSVLSVSTIINSLACGIRARWPHHFCLFSFIATFRNIIFNSWCTLLFILLSRSEQPKVLLTKFIQKIVSPAHHLLLMHMFYWLTLLQETDITLFIQLQICPQWFHIKLYFP